jgi:protein-S-isoprenylcysteine O-methyltransferase Ste14
MDIREFFFKYRSYTPIPLALLIIYFAQPSLPFISVGAICLLLGEAIRFWAVSYAGGVTRTRQVGAPSLCTAGPFRYVRNPLYLGNMLMYTGIVFIAGAPNLLAMLITTWLFFAVQYLLIISLEEETLTNLFGEEYRNYQHHVPRLIPRLRGWKKPVNHTPAPFWKTLNTERRTLQNVLLILILLTLRIQVL